MGQVPIYFENAFLQVAYQLRKEEDKIFVDVTVEHPTIAAYTGKQFSICLHSNKLEIPVNGSVDRAIKFQLVAKIFRQENIDA